MADVPKFRKGDAVMVKASITSFPVVIQEMELHYPGLGSQPYWRYALVLNGVRQWVNEEWIAPAGGGDVA